MHNGRRPHNNEKPKNFKKSMQNLIKFCRPYLIPIILAVILAIISSILSIIGPDKLRDITNTIMEGLVTGIDMAKVKSISLTLLIIYIISSIFGYIEQYIMAVVTNKFSKDCSIANLSKGLFGVISIFISKSYFFNSLYDNL